MTITVTRKSPAPAACKQTWGQSSETIQILASSGRDITFGVPGWEATHGQELTFLSPPPNHSHNHPKIPPNSCASLSTPEKKEEAGFPVSHSVSSLDASSLTRGFWLPLAWR